MGGTLVWVIVVMVNFVAGSFFGGALAWKRAAKHAKQIVEDILDEEAPRQADALSTFVAKRAQARFCAVLTADAANAIHVGMAWRKDLRDADEMRMFAAALTKLQEQVAQQIATAEKQAPMVN